MFPFKVFPQKKKIKYSSGFTQKCLSSEQKSKKPKDLPAPLLPSYRLPNQVVIINVTEWILWCGVNSLGPKHGQNLEDSKLTADS